MTKPGQNVTANVKKIYLKQKKNEAENVEVHHSPCQKEHDTLTKIFHLFTLFHPKKCENANRKQEPRRVAVKHKYPYTI